MGKGWQGRDLALQVPSSFVGVGIGISLTWRPPLRSLNFLHLGMASIPANERVKPGQAHAAPTNNAQRFETGCMARYYPSHLENAPRIGSDPSAHHLNEV